MFSRALTVTFVSALALAAYTGCGDGTDTGGTIGSGYHPGGATTATPGNGATGSSSGGATGSSGGATASSSGGTTSSSGGSSSGVASSSSGSSSGAPASDAGTPLTLQEAFTQFASCMSYTDFTSKGTNGVAAADIAKAQTTQYGDCNACHNAGDGGFWASYGTVQGQNMTQTMFTQTQAFPYIAKWVTGTVDANGNFKDLAPSNAIADQAVLASQCTQGTPCHPKFQLNPDVAQAITDFVTTTITKWHDNACTGSGLPSSDAGLGGGG
jgi:hypothetical protein